MISDVDEALRNLIKQGLTVSQQAVNIAYDKPSRDWTARLNKPTIDLFLFDIRENLRLRGAEQQRVEKHSDGTVEVFRNPVRIDLRYLLTAWTKDPEDEHLLLSDALMVLLRNPYLPQRVLSETLKQQPFPIPMDAAVFQPEHGPTDKITDIWSVLDNDIHAGFIVTVTVTVDPYAPDVFTQVKTVERRFGERVAGETTLAAGSEDLSFYEVGYQINPGKYSLSTLSVVFCEQNLPLTITPGGRFQLPKLPAGSYNIDVLSKGKVIKHQTIQIPSDSCEVIL